MSGSPALQTGRLLLAFSTLVCLVLCTALWCATAQSTNILPPQTLSIPAQETVPTTVAQPVPIPKPAAWSNVQTADEPFVVVGTGAHTLPVACPNSDSASSLQLSVETTNAVRGDCSPVWPQEAAHVRGGQGLHERDGKHSLGVRSRPFATAAKVPHTDNDDPQLAGKGIPDLWRADPFADAVPAEHETLAQQPVSSMPAPITIHVDGSAVVSEMSSLVNRVERVLTNDRRADVPDHELATREAVKAERRVKRVEQRRDEVLAKLTSEVAELAQTMDSLQGETASAVNDLAAKVADSEVRRLRFSSLVEQVARQHSLGQGGKGNSAHSVPWVRQTSRTEQAMSASGPSAAQPHHTGSTAPHWLSLQPGSVRISDLAPSVQRSRHSQGVAEVSPPQRFALPVLPPPMVSAPAADRMIDLPPNPADSAPTGQALLNLPMPAVPAESAEPVERLSFVECSPNPLRQPARRPDSAGEPGPTPATTSGLEGVVSPEAPSRSNRDAAMRPVVFEHTYEFEQAAEVVELPGHPRHCCQAAHTAHCESCQHHANAAPAGSRTPHKSSHPQTRPTTHRHTHVRKVDPRSLNAVQRGLRSVRTASWMPDVDIPAWANGIPDSRPVKAVRDSRFLHRVSSVFRQTPSGRTVD